MRWIFVLMLAGCEGVMPGFDWQQMNDQHKFEPFEACSYFSDGRAMQTPPLGTVPHGKEESTALEQAFSHGVYLDRFPIPLTRELFTTGRFAFETYCAACHGLDGSGQSEVATNMELRKPPSLMTEPVRSFPPGRIFQVASEGYGLMPAYSIELSANERWAVVAYLVALERSQSVNLDGLPPELRRDALSSIAEQRR